MYIDRTIVFNFDSDYKYFRLTNHIRKSILVIVDLEKLQETISLQGAVHNDNFTIPVKKLETIRQEIISGEKLRAVSYTHLTLPTIYSV